MRQSGRRSIHDPHDPDLFGLLPAAYKQGGTALDRHGISRPDPIF